MDTLLRRCMASLPRKHQSIFEDLLGRLHAEHFSEIGRLNGEISLLRQLVHRPAPELLDSKEQPWSSGEDSIGDTEPTPCLTRPRASPTLANRRSPSPRGSGVQNHREYDSESSNYCKVLAVSPELAGDCRPSSTDGEMVDITEIDGEASASAAATLFDVGPMPEPVVVHGSESSETSLQHRMAARTRALKSAKEDEALSKAQRESLPKDQSGIVQSVEKREGIAHGAEKTPSPKIGTPAPKHATVRTREELFKALKQASSVSLRGNSMSQIEVPEKKNEKAAASPPNGLRLAGSQVSNASNNSAVAVKQTPSVSFARDVIRTVSAKVMTTNSRRASTNSRRPSVRSGRGSVEIGTTRTSLLSDPDYFEFALRPEWADEHEEERNTTLARAQSKMITTRRRSTKNLETLVLEDELTGCQKVLCHPSGQTRLCWDTFGMLMIGYDMITIPLQAFEPESAFLDIIGWVALIFWTLEIPMSCLTGYHEDGVVVLEFKRILIHYIRTWLALDVFIVTIDWVFRLQTGGSEGDEADKARLLRSFRFLRFLRTIRLLRLLKLKKILQEVEDRINSEAVSIYFNVFKIVMFLLALNHIIACSWYSVGSAYNNADMENWIASNNLVHEPFIYRYATSLHWSLTQFTPASMEIRPFNVGERLFAIVVLLFALVAFSSFVSSLTSSMTHLRNIRTNETRQFWLLRRYLRDQSIPGELSRRIQRYLEYAYQRRQNKVQAGEVSLLALLSEKLRDELNHEAYVDLIATHPLFAQLNPRNKIFFKATKSEAMAAGDHVFSFGNPAKGMYCLQESMAVTEGLEYIMPDVDGGRGGNTQHVTDIEWMCEASLWLECWMHMGDMMAVSECHIVQVDATKFTKATIKSPMAAVSAQAYAFRFLETVNCTAKSDLTDLTSRFVKMGDLVALKNERRFSFDGMKADLFGELLSIKDAFTSPKNRRSDEEKGMTVGHTSSSGEHSAPVARTSSSA